MSDSPASFIELRDSLQKVGNGYSVEVGERWRQGRTAYGGATAALSLAAANLAISDLPPLRSMLVNFTGPVVENPVFVPNCLRTGKSVTTVEVTVNSQDNIAARIIFTFGGNRPSSLTVPRDSMTIENAPEDYELYTPKEVEAFAPQFVVNFDTRLIAGERPVSGSEEGYVRTVSRHKAVESRSGIECLVALADVLPPAAICMTKTLAPVSSVTWMMNMLTDDPATQDGWYQVEARLSAASNGYSSQQMGIWSLDGTPIAEGMQCVAQFF